MTLMAHGAWGVCPLELMALVSTFGTFGVVWWRVVAWWRRTW